LCQGDADLSAGALICESGDHRTHGDTIANFTRFYGIVPTLYVRVHRLQALFPETMGHGISEGSCLSMQAAANHTVWSGQSSHCDPRATLLFCFPGLARSLLPPPELPIGGCGVKGGKKRYLHGNSNPNTASLPPNLPAHLPLREIL